MNCVYTAIKRRVIMALQGPALFGLVALLVIIPRIDGQTLIEGIGGTDTGGVLESTPGFGKRPTFESIIGEENIPKDRSESKKLDKVIRILENLQAQINTLKISVEKIQEQQALLNQTKPCVEKDAVVKHTFDITNCGNRTADQGQFFIVDATYGTWEEHVFCRIFSFTQIKETNYVVSASMYNVIGYHGIDFGFPGLAYNIENNQNFDFVYVRLHRKNACFQTGYVQNNKIQWIGTKNGPCPDGPPKGRSWFKLTMYVRDSEAQLYLDDIQVLVFNPHFPSIGRGGVIVATGQKNVVRFRDFQISPIKPFPFSVYNCKSYHRISSDYYRLDAEYGSWPDSGFCKAINRDEIPDKNYVITASLFNQRGYSGTPHSGVLGMMFNAQDQYNFDFVYFRPRSLGGCYTTGFVQNTNINWVNSKIGACPGGPFKGAVWNNVTIYVREDDVSIQLDGKHLVTTKSHFPSRARGGVIVGNGIDNVASFKHYRVAAIEPSEFIIQDCTASSRSTQQYHILDAKHGRWPEDSFCRAISKKIVPGNNYLISAELFIQGWRATDDENSFMGLAFNAKDPSNYDFVYVRATKSGYCYKIGYVMNGAIQFPMWQEGKCPGGSPEKGVWFKMSVAIRESSAFIQIDGKHLVTVKPHFHVFSRGGVIVANGERNVLTFRNFQSRVIKPFEFKFSRCGSKTHQSNGSFVMDGMLPRWPLHGFCSAMSINALKTYAKKYSVQARIHNIDSWHGADWGNAGLMFNALDENNYDYVYIRMHNKENCFQFGSLVAGVIRERSANSGPCKGVRPKQGQWFNIRVQVTSKNAATVYLENVDLGKYVASNPWYTRGGVVVQNGSKNVIMFREFSQIAKK